MKTGSLIPLIAGCVLLPVIAYGEVAHPAPQQSSGNSTTNAGSDHSGDAEHATVSSQSKQPKETVASDEHGNSRHIPNRIRPRSRTSLNKTNHPKKVQHNLEHSRPEGVTSMHQQVLTKPADAASKVVTRHTPPVRPATGVAISGQQFRNGRNRSATPAVIGGPANPRRNTEAINGTEVNRKHLN